MKSSLVFLSVLLVFAGIAAIFIINLPGISLPQKHQKFKSTQNLRNEFVVKKHSMREIDSITAATNFSFTIENAVTLSDENSVQKLTTNFAANK